MTIGSGLKNSNSHLDEKQRLFFTSEKWSSFNSVLILFLCRNKFRTQISRIKSHWPGESAESTEFPRDGRSVLYSRRDRNNCTAAYGDVYNVESIKNEENRGKERKRRKPRRRERCFERFKSRTIRRRFRISRSWQIIAVRHEAHRSARLECERRAAGKNDKKKNKK